MSWLPKKLVIVPFDFSETSVGAVETALQMVDDASHVHVVHCLPELVPTEPGVIWSTVNDEDRNAHVVEAIGKQLEEAKYKNVVVKSFIGDPGHSIADYAEENKADLIVMPSHGRTGLTRLLIGSVAERVIRLAHCPVLVLRN